MEHEQNDMPDNHPEPLVPPTPPSPPTPPEPHKGGDFAIGFGIGIVSAAVIRIGFNMVTDVLDTLSVIPISSILPTLLILGLQGAAAIYCFRRLRRPMIGYGLLTIIGLTLIPLLLVGACLVMRGI
jgi:hypothetical protein